LDCCFDYCGRTHNEKGNTLIHSARGLV
jgi:hypothetical protein